MDYWSTTKKVIQSDLKMTDVLSPHPEHRLEDQNQDFQAEIDHHHSVLQ